MIVLRMYCNFKKLTGEALLQNSKNLSFKLNLLDKFDVPEGLLFLNRSVFCAYSVANDGIMIGAIFWIFVEIKTRIL